MLTLSSAKADEPLELKGDFREGGVLYIYFCDNGKTVLGCTQGKNRAYVQAESTSFQLGAIDSPCTLTVGRTQGSAPFAGMFGPIALLDKDISSVLQGSSGAANNLIRAIAQPNAAAFETLFALCTIEPADDVIRALVGIGFPAERREDKPAPRFDFIPREILCPQDDASRWMLENGAKRPVKVDLKYVVSSEHSIYSTNAVFCFLRFAPKTLGAYERPAGVYLWGDQGQRFVLTYLGNNRLKGIASNDYYGGKWSGQEIALTYKPNPQSEITPGRMDIECIGWDNANDRIFANYVCPPGAALPSNIGDDEIWPSKPTLIRMPESYRIMARITEAMSEQWASAFTKSLCGMSASMQGWDVSKLDNPFNPGNSTAAAKDYTGSIFAFPPQDSKYYRAENGSFTPFYCAAAPIDEVIESSETTAYTTVKDVSQKVSKSFGVGLSQGAGGEKSLLNCSFKGVRETGLNGEEDHAVVVNKSVTLSQAVLLEKQWLQFNAVFIDALKNRNVNSPSDLFPIFETWGTHYPHAVTYGWGHYSLAFIDESGATRLSAAMNASSVTASIPIEDCFLNLSGSSETENKSVTQTKSKTEVKTAMQIGSNERLKAMMMDLRPISDLLQPPYLNEADLEWALTAQPFVANAIERYLESRPQLIPDGSVLYQARVVSLENLNDEPCYVNARAFMIGVKKQELGDDTIFFPESPQAINNLQPLWHDSVRLEAKGQNGAAYGLSEKEAQQGTFTSLSISRGDVSIVPEVRMTGTCQIMNSDGITKVLITTPEPLAGAIAGNDAGASNQAPPRYPSPQEIRSKQDSLGPEAVDAVGAAWIPWKYNSPQMFWSEKDENGQLVTTHEQRLIRQQVQFTALPDNGTTQVTTFDVGGVRVTLAARKIDLVQCFSPAPDKWTVPSTTGKT
jgi:hypothetical protein